MPKPSDLSRSPVTLDENTTLIAVIEMSQSNWLVAGLVPGLERRPLKKLSPDEDALLKLVQRWRNEAAQAGREIKRIVIAYECTARGFLDTRCCYAAALIGARAANHSRLV